MSHHPDQRFECGLLGSDHDNGASQVLGIRDSPGGLNSEESEGNYIYSKAYYQAKAELLLCPDTQKTLDSPKSRSKSLTHSLASGYTQGGRHFACDILNTSLVEPPTKKWHESLTGLGKEIIEALCRQTAVLARVLEVVSQRGMVLLEYWKESFSPFWNMLAWLNQMQELCPFVPFRGEEFSTVPPVSNGGAGGHRKFTTNVHIEVEEEGGGSQCCAIEGLGSSALAGCKGAEGCTRHGLGFMGTKLKELLDVWILHLTLLPVRLVAAEHQLFQGHIADGVFKGLQAASWLGWGWSLIDMVVLKSKDYLVIGALLDLVGLLIPSNKMEEGKAKWTAFIKELFGSTERFSCSLMLVDILQYMCGEYCYNSVANLIDYYNQDNINRSITVSYSHIHTMTMFTSNLLPPNKAIVRVDLTNPPHVGETPLNIPRGQSLYLNFEIEWKDSNRLIEALQQHGISFDQAQGMQMLLMSIVKGSTPAQFWAVLGQITNLTQSLPGKISQ
ncbi:hypothetical protein F4604DRAFT_1691708 [Suillus subluteus]|nr:hypothetical protein F4604DRAFT_1691708 [Suillus subluteus]